MGIRTHGLSRVVTYVDRIMAGGIDPVAKIEVTHRAPALCSVEGRGGLGPAVAELARRSAADAARTCGVGAAFIAGGSHLGALAPYLYRAAEEGFAAIAVTNTAPMIAPAGGRDPILGNSPIGLAIPDPDGSHIILDMALSGASRSSIREAAREGRAIPADWATDADGHPTTSADAALKGLLKAIGGDKGANLALSLDLLVGMLSGAALLSEIPNAFDRPGAAQNLGQAFVLIDADKLLPAGARRDRMLDARRILAESRPLDPARPIRLPGDRALESLRLARLRGIEIDRELDATLRRLAGR